MYIFSTLSNKIKVPIIFGQPKLRFIEYPAHEANYVMLSNVFTLTHRWKAKSALLFGYRRERYVII